LCIAQRFTCSARFPLYRSLEVHATRSVALELVVFTLAPLNVPNEN
jgi:hypothetical protein